jgi:hypothetical protein
MRLGLFARRPIPPIIVGRPNGEWRPLIGYLPQLVAELRLGRIDNIRT